jgi:hypothetical protein
LAGSCSHLDQIKEIAPNTDGCEECIKTGGKWIHLRLCLTCGHVGCCDDSKNKHATKHFYATDHPVIESLETGDNWRWCYVDEVLTPTIRAADRSAFVDLAMPLGSDSPGFVADDRSLLNTSYSPGDKLKRMFKSICGQVRRCNRENLEPVIELAVEIAREGREGRRIGTLFTFGDAESVLRRSRPLILDPLAGHPEQEKDIRNPNLRGTIKELAQLDGAFVVSDKGVVVSACRYLDATASNVALTYGLGSRHLAGGSISQVTDAVAIVVSESSMVRIFDDGKLIAEIIPELWLLDHYNVQLAQPYDEQHEGDVAVLVAKQ